jgi:hypothetical protein
MISDSIIDEQIKFYSKLFTTEGWDENSANKLTQHIESKLNGDEKETLELDVSIEEIIKFSNSSILPLMLSPSSVLDLRSSSCFSNFSMSFLF